MTLKTSVQLPKTVFAIYHSHLTSAIFPSMKDLEDVDYPSALYFMISLNTQGILDLRGFYLRDKKIDEVDLSI